MVNILSRVKSIDNIGKKQEEFQNTIYNGSEPIKFQERHPIFKALMKIEFEDALRSYHKNINNKSHEFRINF